MKALPSLLLAVIVTWPGFPAAAQLTPEIERLITETKPLTPAQALAAMKTEPGLRVELAAAEPLTGDPVALAFDERGRMYVAENRGYPEGAPDGTPMGVIALLEDTNRDGTFDKRTEFATGLTYPNGLTCWRGGVFVTCAPDVFWIADTNGDGKADVKKTVLTGFELGKTTQIRVAHPTLGLDGWIHLTSGLTGGKVSSPENPRGVVEFSKNDSRFRPDTYEFETFPGVGQFGLCFDDLGRKFTVDNRHPLQMIVLPPRYLKRNPYLAFSEMVVDVAPSGEAGKVFPLARDQTTASMHPGLIHTPHAGTFTSACGISFFGGDALPEGFQGNAFTCEPAQALVQRQVILPDGAVLKAVPGRSGTQVLVTADSWFRPVFSTTGPDGALYIASMYRKFIDHPQYVPAEMRDKLDFISGRHQGRIYRVVAENKKISRKSFDLGRESTRELVSTLEHTNSWFRQTAFRLLLERRDESAPKALARLTERSRKPEARVLALRLLGLQGALNSAILTKAFNDPDAGVRETALQLAEPIIDTPGAVDLGHRLNLGEPFSTGGDDVSALVYSALQLTEDSDPRVRFQAALTLGAHDYRGALNRLAAVAVRDANDRWTRAAVLAACGKSPITFLEAVLTRVDYERRSAAANPGLPALFQELGRVLGASQPAPAIASVLAKITSAQQLSYDMKAGAISGLGEAARQRKLALAKVAEIDPVARDGFQRVLQQAATQVEDQASGLDQRQTAISLLAFADAASATPALRSLIQPQQPAELQSAAVKVLFALSPADAAAFLLEPARWKSLTPPVREAALAALLSQAAGINALLTALESGAIAPVSLEPARRNQLLKHRDKAVASRAAKLFEGITGGDRMKVYEQFKPVLQLPANPAGGKPVFAKTCANCHRLNNEGSNVGPELTGIRNQPAEVLLLHILVPSYEIVSGFNNYEVETTDGRTISGLLASETPTSVTLRRALGEQDTVLRTQIASMTSSPLSLMPDELEKTMTRQELRDLIAYLRGE